MTLSASQLGKDIVAAFEEVFAEKWPDMKEYGEAESKKMAQAFVMIEALRASGKINEEQAELHLVIQKNATRTVFLAVEGLGILAVEALINAALDVVKDAVNTALGFELI